MFMGNIIFGLIPDPLRRCFKHIQPGTNSYLLPAFTWYVLIIFEGLQMKVAPSPPLIVSRPTRIIPGSVSVHFQDVGQSCKKISQPEIALKPFWPRVLHSSRDCSHPAIAARGGIQVCILPSLHFLFFLSHSDYPIFWCFFTQIPLSNPIDSPSIVRDTFLQYL